MADIINPGAVPLTPAEMQMQMMAIERQRKIAEALQQQSMQAPEGQMVSGHYIAPSFTQYLAKVAQGLAGKNQQSDLDAKQLAIATQQGDVQRSMYGIGPRTAQAAPQEQPASVPSMGLGSGMTGTDDASQASRLGTQQLASVAKALLPQQPQQSQPASPQVVAPGSRLIPGMDPYTAFSMGTDPKTEAAYAAAYLDQFKPTDLQKNDRYLGITQAQSRADEEAKRRKEGYIAPTSLRPGGYAQEADGSIRQLPQVPEGFQAVSNGQGGWKIVPVEGGSEAIASTSVAKARGPATFNTQKVWNPKTNQYEYQTAANVSDAAGGTGGAGGNFPSVAPEVQKQRDLQAIEAAKWDLQNATTPQEKKLAQQALDTMVARANAGQSALTGTAKAPMAAEAPIGQPEFAAGQAKAASDRANETRKFASDSPMRVNVLDNILELSRKGVDTGPTSEFHNAMKGAVASAPLFGNTDMAKKWKGEVSDYQEMSKFLMQNAQRAWQSAGGTGTDAQLEASIAANINKKLFPQAVQQMGQWAKAGEIAGQAKANAQDAWLAKNGENPKAQQQFEQTWRTNFDPRIFQLNVMNPVQQKAFVSQLSPADAKALLAKRAAVRELGGF